MNTDKLARTTFVLDRATSESLSRISRRMGVSRSALVREVLAEPVELMAKWVDSVPDGFDTAAASQAVSEMTVDLLSFINEKSPLIHSGSEGS